MEQLGYSNISPSHNVVSVTVKPFDVAIVSPRNLAAEIFLMSTLDVSSPRGSEKLVATIFQ